MKYVFKKICLKKFKLPDFLIRLDDFWKDFTVILYQDGMGRGVAHSRGDMRDTASGHTEIDVQWDCPRLRDSTVFDVVHGMLTSHLMP